MPACAAHYLFGQDVLGRLDADLRACALAYKKEYNLGLQGPDIFFFHKPYRKTEISQYGMTRHEEPGLRMFGPILAEKREKAALSYLIGLICHYTLDACCHPYVNGHSRSSADHGRMESAYDRQLMLRRGLEEPRYLFIPVSGPDFRAMASLWPGMGADTVRGCVRSMRFYIRLLDRKEVLRILEGVLGKRGAFPSLVLPGSVPPEQREHMRRLDALYAGALEKAPARIRAACGAMGTSQPCPAGFGTNYEGENADEQAGEKLDSL